MACLSKDVQYAGCTKHVYVMTITKVAQGGSTAPLHLLHIQSFSILVAFVLVQGGIATKVGRPASTVRSWRLRPAMVRIVQKNMGHSVQNQGICKSTDRHRDRGWTALHWRKNVDAPQTLFKAKATRWCQDEIQQVAHMDNSSCGVKRVISIETNSTDTIPQPTWVSAPRHPRAPGM